MEDQEAHWEAWRGELAGRLSGLADGAFVNAAGPRVTRDRASGLFGRRRRPVVLSEPVVRFLRMGDSLLAETVKPFPAADEPAVDDATRDRLRALGWLMPGDEAYEPMGGPYCRRYLPADQVGEAAVLAARTLVALGVDRPDEARQDEGR